MMLSTTALVLLGLLALLLIGYVWATMRHLKRLRSGKRKVTFILHKRSEILDLRSIANEHDAIWGSRNSRSSN